MFLVWSRKTNKLEASMGTQSAKTAIDTVATHKLCLRIIPSLVVSVGPLFAMLVVMVSLDAAQNDGLKRQSSPFFDQYCIDCHDSESMKGGLDLAALTLDLEHQETLKTWIKVFDRVSKGEMPPKKRERPNQAHLKNVTQSIANTIIEFEETQTSRSGRAPRRRLNRDEYENALRDLLHAPWLPLKGRLPEDAIAHHYPKSGKALDISHVQLEAYLKAAEFALREVIAKRLEAPPSNVTRYYAREQKSFTRATWKHTNEQERCVIPVNGFKSQYQLFGSKGPMSVGDSDPATREIEGFVEVASQANNYLMWFDKFAAPVAGRYKIRLNMFSAWIGPSGREPGMPHRWWIPDLANVTPSHRTEPVTVYAETYPRKYRMIGKLDAQIEPSVHEINAWLLEGETIHPDASRFFRSRQGASRFRRPLATPSGSPGVGFRWLEVEGPIIDEWPPAGHRLLFGELPLKALPSPDDGSVTVTVDSQNYEQDAERLLRRFLTEAYRQPVSDEDVIRFLGVARSDWQNGRSFADAMITAYTAVLSSSRFLTLIENPGPLDSHALASRLSFFLQNTSPDETLRLVAERRELPESDVLRMQTERLLNGPGAAQFIESFTDYWLDLRKVHAISPDPIMYADYYLDDLLNESAVAETRAFVAELIRHDLPVRNVIDSDFLMVNEKLAALYGLPDVQGVAIRRVPVPVGSPRGGLLTQASVLKITTDGNTTSPVKRGAWIIDRILGRPPSPPPASVPAVEADTRGATTIREQLQLHRNSVSCAACHKDIDPPGFALESFDVAGGFRERYRGVNAGVLPEIGVGRVGQRFEFHYALPVDSKGQMPDGTSFANINEFKKILLRDEQQLARNVVSQLIVYATGTPVRFSDRALVEAILDRAQASEFGFRTLVHEVVQSQLFRHK